MPFAINDRVICIDPIGALVRDQEYVVTWVSGMRTAICVNQNRQVYMANRFEAALVVVVEAPPPPAPVDPLFYYLMSEFEGCCGANILFFNNQPINKRSLDYWFEEAFGYDDEDKGEYLSVPLYIGILNESQHTDAAQRALLDRGFRFLTTSRANGGGVLYTYCFNRGGDVPAFTPIEIQRSF